MRVAVAVATTILLLNLYAPAHPTTRERILGSLLIVECVIPLWLWLAGRHFRSPLIPFVAVLYAVYYAAPVFLLERYTLAWYWNQPVSDSAVGSALWLSIIGVAALTLGYFNRLTDFWARVEPKVHLRWVRPKAVQSAAVLLCIVGLTVRLGMFRYLVFGINDAIPSAAQQVFYFATETPVLGATMLYLLDVTGVLSPRSHWFLWLVVTPGLVGVGLAQAAIRPAVETLLSFLFLSVMIRGRIPWLLMAVGLVLVLMVLQPLKLATRGLDANRQLGVSPIERSWGVAQLLGRELSSADTETMALKLAVWQGADRVNGLTPFSWVVDLTPSVVPYWSGHSYGPFLSKLIPRVLYPRKPLDDMGQEWPHRYQLLAPSDQTTTFRLFQLVEAYVNFGGVGVVVVMFLIGTFYRLSEGLFVNARMGAGAAVGAAYVLSNWLDIEGNASLVFGGVVWQLCFLGAAHLLVKAFERDGGSGRN